MNRGMTGKRIAMVLIGVFGFTAAMQAATVTWTGANSANWSVASNWSSNPSLPGSGDDVFFQTASLTAVYTDVNASFNSLTFTANTATLTLSNNSGVGGNKTLTLGAGGLTNSTGNIALGSTTAGKGLNVVLGASQTWTINATMTANNVISGSGMALTKAGSSVLTLNGANTFDGGLNIVAGTIYANASGCLGNGTVTMGASADVILRVSGCTVAKDISLAGTSGKLTLQVASTSGNQAYSGTVTGARDLVISTFGSGSSTISGLLNNTGVVTWGGGGTLTLSGNIGTNVVGLLANTSASGNTLTLSGACDFYGYVRDTASKGILNLTHRMALQNAYLDTANMALGNATDGLKTDQTALTFGGLTGAKALSTLFMTGGGYSGLTGLTLNPGEGKSHSYSGTLADGAAGMTLTKTGTGTQTLTGTLSYSGATTVSNGVLDVSSATTFASTNWTLAASGTLKVGTTNLSGKNLAVGVNSANAGLLDVTGNLTLGGNLTMTGSSTVPRKIAQTTGTISGTFSTTSLPSGFVLTLRNSNKELWAGYPSGTMVSFF